MANNGRPASANEVLALKRAIVAGAPKQGRLSSHMQDVKYLKPEIAGIDILSFPCSVTAAGVITQPQTQSIPSGFAAELFAIKGYMQLATESGNEEGELMPLIDFNIKDRERSGDLFSTNLEMAYLCTTQGPTEGLCWDRGLYVFDPGSRVQVQYSIDGDSSLGYVANAAATKEWGVLLIVNLYAVS